MSKSENGIAQYVLLILIVLGLILGVVLSQQTQIFRPRADDSDSQGGNIPGIGNRPQYVPYRTVGPERSPAEILSARLDSKIGRLYLSGKNFGSTPGKITIYNKEDIEILSAIDIPEYVPNAGKDHEVWTPGDIMVDLQRRIGIKFDEAENIKLCPSGTSESVSTSCSTPVKISKSNSTAITAEDTVSTQSGRNVLGQTCSPVDGKDACLSTGAIAPASWGIQCKSYDIGPYYWSNYNVPLPNANPGLCVYFSASYPDDACQYNLNCWGHAYLGYRCKEGKCQ